MALLAALLLAAVTAADLVGLYETQQIEVAAALELRRDGRYRYALEYGAASERAEGSWSFDGTTVRLTSDPHRLLLEESADASFSNEPLVLREGDLFLERHETIFRFRRVEP